MNQGEESIGSIKLDSFGSFQETSDHDMAETVSLKSMEYVVASQTRIKAEINRKRFIFTRNLFAFIPVSKTKERAGCTIEWRKKKWQSIVN